MLHYVESIYPQVDAVVPNIIYEVESLTNNILDVDILRALSDEQEYMITRLTQLLVKIHNVSVTSASDTTKKDRFDLTSNRNDDIPEDLFMEELDRLIKKLLNIEEKIDKLAYEKGVPLTGIDSLALLEEEQRYISCRVVNLECKLNNIASMGDIDTSDKAKKVINVSVHANPRSPPLSLFLMLARLRGNGRRVACLSLFSSKMTYQPHPIICEFIKRSLCLLPERDTHEMIVSVVWKDCLAYDCVLLHDVYNDIPFFGEMMSLMYLCSLLGVEVTGVLDQTRLINEQLHEAASVKSSLASLNNKLYKDVHATTDADAVFSGFVVSSLLVSNSVDKMNSKLRAAVAALLEHHSLNIDELAI